MGFLDVHSEIGRLRQVLVHRPGEEISNLIPQLMEQLLFDDIPYLELMQMEHDAFVNVMRQRNVEVVYLTDLFKQSLLDNEVKTLFIEQFLDESQIFSPRSRLYLTSYFNNLSEDAFVNKVISGVRVDELPKGRNLLLSDYIYADYPFALNPLPNLYFTRDPFATIGNGVALNPLKKQARKRESIFAEYIFKYHPLYSQLNVPTYYNRNEEYSLEGGDILILSDKVIAFGVTERTSPVAIEIAAYRILGDPNNSFETALAFDIPDKRVYMHLDTVLTMVDKNKFMIYEPIKDMMKAYVITKNGGQMKVVPDERSLTDIFKQYLELDDVIFIPCGGGEPIVSARDQWHSGSNTLAISPGEVITYSRNRRTNEVLEDEGVKVHAILSNELTRGRGGPHCMGMPLIRDRIMK